MMSFLMILNIFMIRQGTVLISLGDFKIYTGGFIQTAYILIRLVLIVDFNDRFNSNDKTIRLNTGTRTFI